MLPTCRHSSMATSIPSSSLSAVGTPTAGSSAPARHRIASVRAAWRDVPVLYGRWRAVPCVGSPTRTSKSRHALLGHARRRGTGPIHVRVSCGYLCLERPQFSYRSVTLRCRRILCGSELLDLSHHFLHHLSSAIHPAAWCLRRACMAGPSAHGVVFGNSHLKRVGRKMGLAQTLLPRDSGLHSSSLQV